MKKKLQNRWTKVKNTLFPDNLMGDIFSFIAAFIVAFLFLQTLGFFLDTQTPLVVIESESMLHQPGWQSWHSENGLPHDSYPFGGGINIGDISLVKGDSPEDIQIGDVIVYNKIVGLNTLHPIIHRVVGVVEVGEDIRTEGAVKFSENKLRVPCNYNSRSGYDLDSIKTYYSKFKDFNIETFRLFITKGDNNAQTDQCLISSKPTISMPVHESLLVGKSKFNIPFLGNVKLAFICGANYLSGNVCPSRCWWTRNNPGCN